MGFEVDSEYSLEWPEGSPFHGMQVVMRSMNIGTLFRLDEISLETRELDVYTAEGRERGRALYMERLESIAKHGVRWNLERAGVPVPFTADGLATLERKQIAAIQTGWMQSVTEVPDPLLERSDATPPFPEESIPMEVST